MGLRVGNELRLGRRRGLSVAGGFDPLSLSPQAWWKADSLALSDGQAVASWSDSSGNGNTATQATAGARPTYRVSAIGSRPGVEFDGGDALTMTDALVLLKPFTYTFVVQVTALATFQTIVAGDGGPYAHVRINQTDGFPNLDKQGTAGIGTATSGVSAATPAVVTVTYGAAGAYAFFVNGTAAGSGTNDQTFAAGGSAVGVIGSTKVDASQQQLIGYLPELLVFNAALSTTNRQSVESYLAGRYAL